ncbi:MAG TPA: hypothetical protein VN700_05380 [Vicinamibacterales bacterium]|nr:hypothetical protein [Vicinamibacterales bacterium]
MALNSFTVGLQVADLPQFCGPRDLSNTFVLIRRHLNPQSAAAEPRAPISDAGIHRLVQLAYQTSLAEEEGRFPEFKLVNARLDASDNSLAATLDVPLDDLDSLRRLAPAVFGTHAGLLVSEDGDADSLRCRGIVVTGEMGRDIRIGRPEIVPIGKPPSLIVRVLGPAHLRLTEGWYTLVLERGRIRQIVDYGLVEQVSGLWKEFAAGVLDRIVAARGDDARQFFGGADTLADFTHKAWSRVLASSMERRHGGTFVVLPGSGRPEDFDIRCTYAPSVAFGDAVHDFWDTCIEHFLAKDGAARERADHDWNWRRSAVFAKADIVSGLSSVDGCVVLDRNLRVSGFGGEILVDPTRAAGESRSLRNLKTGDPMPETELDRLGTRHRSAYRLVKTHPGVVAFVVSQDGDLRIFTSTDEDVFGFDRLHAWVHQSESE